MKKLNLNDLEVKSFVTSLKKEGQGTKEVEGGTVVYTPACPNTVLCPQTLLCPQTQICPIETAICPIDTIVCTADCSLDCSFAGCPTGPVC